jgi:ubiquinone/menaquinone biosynthesis C-methylase UbiE
MKRYGPNVHPKPKSRADDKPAPYAAGKPFRPRPTPAGAGRPQFPGKPKRPAPGAPIPAMKPTEAPTSAVAPVKKPAPFVQRSGVPAGMSGRATHSGRNAPPGAPVKTATTAPPKFKPPFPVRGPVFRGTSQRSGAIPEQHGMRAKGRPNTLPSAKPVSPVGSVAAATAVAPDETHWGPQADWYDQLVGDAGSEYHQKVVIPGVLRLLKPTLGSRVLDVGCGQGVLCRVLQKEGAKTVGVDAAKPLIDIARQRDPDGAYLVGDAKELPSIAGLEAGSFDSVTSMLAIQNIDPLLAVFKGMSWALKPGGRLVLVMMHPSFRGPKATSWGWCTKTAVQYRRVDRYLVPRKEQIISHPGLNDGKYTWSFHRPLHSYVRAMAQSGLLIDGMEEWQSHKVSAPGGRAKAENIARNEVPLFMAIRAVKSM